MKRLYGTIAGLCAVALTAFGCAYMPGQSDAGWITLIDEWNTLVIKARDTHLSVELNGFQTVTVYDSKSAEGPFALQFGNHGKVPGGAIKWRKVQIKPL